VGSGEIQDVLAQVGVIAAARGWTPVLDFIAVLPAADDVVLLAAERVDAEQLADWLVTSSSGAAVSIAPLEALPRNPGMGLYADRVVVAFQCSQLMTLEGIEAAQQLMLRPPGSYAIVFTGAEDVRNQEDLSALERGIWQALIGDPDVRWAGQNLSDYRCVLWSAVPSTGFLAERLDRDCRYITEWLRHPVTGQDDLAALRAEFALQLAEGEAAASAGHTADSSADPPAPDGLHEAQQSLEGIRSSLLKLMDADAAYLDSETAASLTDLRGRINKDLAERVNERGDARWTDQELRQEIERGVGRGLDSWHAEMTATIQQRLTQTDSAAGKLLRGVDWNVINSVAVGAGKYPDVILGHVRALGAPGFDLAGVPATSTALPLPGSDTRTTAIRIGASGAVLAGVVAIFAWPAVVPIVASGAVGAVGGALVDRRLDARTNHQVASALGTTAVTHAVESVLDAARAQVQEAARAARRAVMADFREIGDALHTAILRRAAQSAAQAPPLPAGGATPGAGPDRARVAELRKRLNAALDSDRG
jgi:hypothetical protein